MIRLAAFLILWTGSASAHEVPGYVDRFRDGDTFEGGTYFPRFHGSFRLYCVDTPESFGSESSEAGKQISEVVKGLKIKRGAFEVVKPGTFRDYLVWFTPEGWKISLNKWLWQRGVPLYDGLTSRERRVCLDRLGERP